MLKTHRFADHQLDSFRELRMSRTFDAHRAQPYVAFVLGE